jgi:MFS family permease
VNAPTSAPETGRRSRRFGLAADDLLRDRVYRRLWSSILMSSFGGQITLLALPLTAAVLLHATPTQMGVMTTMEILPFVLLSLPGGVYLDRVRKLPVYVVGEGLMALAVASVPLAWWLGWLDMHWLYAVAFAIGLVHTVAGSAAQIVLTQIVPRERLVEAHARNALANSTAEVMGPGLAGVLIRAVGAPFALCLTATLLASSALILRGVRATEGALHAAAGFRAALADGVRFVAGNRLLVVMAATVGVWQFCHNAALVVQILFATRTLGLDERGVGLCYVALGAGTIAGSALGNRISRRAGPGPAIVLSFLLCGLGWLCGAAAPVNRFGVGMFALMLALFGFGATLLFVNFIALRQSVTPAPLLGRMTSTMRWLFLLPAGPGALAGGWVGEHIGLRATLCLSGVLAMALTALAWRSATLRGTTTLPKVAEQRPTRESMEVPESQPGEFLP